MPKLTTARCQKCGKESQVEWTLGTKCPRCGSENFLPVVYIDKRQDAGGQREAVTRRVKPLKGLLAILFLVVGVAALIISVRSTMRPKEYYTTYTMICTNCEKRFRQKFLSREILPHVVCPFCKEKTAWRAVQCRNCQTIFALELEGDPTRIADTVCPNCRSGNINLDSGSIPVEEKPEE